MISSSLVATISTCRFDAKVLSRPQHGSSSSGSSIGYEAEVPEPETTPVEDEKKLLLRSTPIRVFCEYLRGGFSCPLLLTVLVFNAVSQFLFHFNDVWLADWTNTQTHKTPENATNTVPQITRHSVAISRLSSDDASRIHFYSVLIAGLFISTFVRSLSFLSMCNRASITIHNSAFGRLMKAPMVIFEETPFGIYRSKPFRCYKFYLFRPLSKSLLPRHVGR